MSFAPYRSKEYSDVTHGAFASRESTSLQIHKMDLVCELAVQGAHDLCLSVSLQGALV